MKITKENILIELPTTKKKKGVVMAGIEYISAKVLDVGAEVMDNIDKGDTLIFEKSDIQLIKYNSQEYRFIHESKAVLYEKRKTKS